MLVSTRFLLGAFLLVVLWSCAQSTDPTPVPSPGTDAVDPATLTFELGPPEVVFTPTALAGAYKLPDSPFLAWRFSTTPSQQMTAYSAAGYTFRLVGPTLASLNRTAILPMPVLGPPPHSNPPPGPADSCGAWLQAVEEDGNVIRGWYHSETMCNYSYNLQTHKSVSYAQSTDGGATWTKPNHPDNVVIQGSNPPCASQCSGPVYQTGAGDPSVIRMGDHYYMYFTDTDQRFPGGYPTWAEGLARSSVASGGLPHTWEKWCDNGWSSVPNCHAKPLWEVGSAAWTVSRSTTLQRLVAIFVNQASGTAPGMQLLISTDGMSWTPIPGVLIYFPPPDANDNQKEIYQYPTLVPEAGGSDWDQTAYLYYMYIYPSEDYIYQRYLFRRRVDMTIHGSPVTTPRAVVPLQRWYSATHQDHWVTTAPICFSGLSGPCHPDTTQYHEETGLLDRAKVYSTGGSGLVALHDCYYQPADDHMISLNPQCERPGEKRLRTLGWIWQASRPGTVPLYRCRDTSDGDHFVSTSPDCEGALQESTLGYAPLAAGN